MINMTALNELMAQAGITPRIERVDLYGELEFMGATSIVYEWPPKARHGEQCLCVGTDEQGEPVAVFIPRD